MNSGSYLDKKNLEIQIKKITGNAFSSFLETAASPRSCSVEIEENIEDSGWKGAWTEKIRESAAACSSGVSCVCVKPVVCGRLDRVYYRISVA